MYNDDREYLDFLIRNNVIISKEPFMIEDRIDDRVINLDQDWESINKSLNDSGLVVIDNFLKEEYAHRLKEFTLFCNRRDRRYTDYASLDFYRGTYLKNQYWFPILTNITEESKELISSLKNLEFNRAWTIIHNSKSYGAPIHGDPGKITMNLWVTPDESMNLESGFNGFSIWKTEPPETWSWEDYLGNANISQEWVDNSNVKPIDIDYKFNRITIFKSKFFHKTQQVSCKEGYENRRINYAFLFGKE